jgi:hypothetical protein
LLDWLLILGRRHLEHVLRIYVQHYNRERPHRELALTRPEPAAIKLSPGGHAHRHDRLGGLVHEVLQSRSLSETQFLTPLKGSNLRPWDQESGLTSCNEPN